MMPDTPIMAFVSGAGHVTYAYADGHTVTLHGTHPNRDKNPGNLRFPGKTGLDRAKAAGAIGIDGGSPSSRRVSRARTRSRLIQRRGNEGQTVQSFLGAYAPADEDDLPTYLLAVTTALKAKPSDTLWSLSADQRAILAETIMRHEGWYSKRSQPPPPVEGRSAPPR